jgi:hypothetical protein
MLSGFVYVMVRFQGKVNDVGRNADLKAIETGIERFESLQVLIAARH